MYPTMHWGIHTPAQCMLGYTPGIWGEGLCIPACTGANTPCPVHAGIHTPRQTPHWANTPPPLGRHPPPPDDHCSGQYASYWNGFLFTQSESGSERENDQRIGGKHQRNFSFAFIFAFIWSEHSSRVHSH